MTDLRAHAAHQWYMALHTGSMDDQSLCMQCRKNAIRSCLVTRKVHFVRADRAIVSNKKCGWLDFERTTNIIMAVSVA